MFVARMCQMLPGSVRQESQNRPNYGPAARPDQDQGEGANPGPTLQLRVYLGTRMG